MELVLQQDDCAIDSEEYFTKKFEEIVGIPFEEYKKNSTRGYGNDHISYYLNGYALRFNAGDPYWKLFK